MEKQLDPLIGRENELERVVQVLSRRGRSNPVLVGEPGVGKRTLVNGLAQRIAEGSVPSFLADKRVLILHLSAFLAGNRQSVQFKELIEKILTRQIGTEAIYARLEALLKQLAGVQNLILVVEELFHPGEPRKLA
jgi:ATP-dependent Clp protease ATP-binding subunit ClpA